LHSITTQLSIFRSLDMPLIAEFLCLNFCRLQRFHSWLAHASNKPTFSRIRQNHPKRYFPNSVHWIHLKAAQFLPCGVTSLLEGDCYLHLPASHKDLFLSSKFFQASFLGCAPLLLYGLQGSLVWNVMSLVWSLSLARSVPKEPQLSPILKLSSPHSHWASLLLDPLFWSAQAHTWHHRPYTLSFNFGIWYKDLKQKIIVWSL